MSEKRDNSGILFKNDRKDKDSHPDYTGNATIDGVDYWMSAWLKEGKRGRFMTFSFKPKEERVPAKASTKIDLDDEIPF